MTLSGTGSIGVDITADTDTTARTARLGLPLLPCVLLNLSASLRAQHGPARAEALHYYKEKPETKHLARYLARSHNP